MKRPPNALTLVGACVMLLLPVRGWAQERPPPAPPAPTQPPTPSPAPPANPPEGEKQPEKKPEAQPEKQPEKAPTTPPPAPAPAPAPAPDEKPAPPAPGTEIVVHLKGGKSMTGLLVRENKDEMVIRISGIETPLRAGDIDRYQVLPPILERYKQYRESIGEDPEQILTLAAWLQAREQYEVALMEVERVLKIDANHKGAIRLRNILINQVELRDNAKPGNARNPANPASPAPAPNDDRLPREPFPLLSDAQINLIKVYEIDLENPPRVNIARATITKMLDQNVGSPLLPSTQEGRDAIYRKPPLEVLDLMFRLKARDLYGEVQVLEQPKAMRLFRDDVQVGWLVNSCATSACHGGMEAGRLALVNRKPRSDTAFYTNFLILDRFRLADGTPLINYDDPAKSPLLQMGLPREDALRKHPVVPHGSRGHDSWKPAFKNTQERNFEHTVAWIKSMYQPRPAYPIEYRPPLPSVTTDQTKKEPVPR